MKEWEKELQIYTLNPAPPKKRDLQEYIILYLTENNETYFSWFLHYYERTVNDKAISIVQDYAIFEWAVLLILFLSISYLHSLRCQTAFSIPWKFSACINLADFFVAKVFLFPR